MVEETKMVMVEEIETIMVEEMGTRNIGVDEAYEMSWKNLMKLMIKGGGEPNQDSNVVTGTFFLNNRYASMLFDFGADRNFVSIAFSSLIEIAPSTLDVKYAVELADKRVVEYSTILRSCTLNLLDHSFNIYLMPIELGSFDIMIGMDWLSKYYTVIVCDEKVVRIIYMNDVLIIHGDRSNRISNSRLNIISYQNPEVYSERVLYLFGSDY
nr:reverse transcriptase domain-containing protein [Tanacetum cinerariifolium]GEY20328.1 reverse transcriptase domain-containing protein [Tanacetum cinerariifolium]